MLQNKVIASLMLALTASMQFTANAQQFASSISECPKLPGRTSPPTNPRDLRPDDIKVIAAMGDRYSNKTLHQCLFPFK